MRVTLWRDDVTVARPVRAAGQVHDVRSRLFVAVTHHGVSGYGEVAPQPFELNGDPSVEQVIDELRTRTVPQMLAACERDGTPPTWTRLARFAGPRSSSSSAIALLEMAVLDWEYRFNGDEISSLWPHHYDTPTQATVSLLDDEPWVYDSKVSRLRVKTKSGTLAPDALTKLSSVNIPIIVDFNCSARNEEDVLAQIGALREVVKVDAVEQPFEVGNLVDHAALAEALDVAVSLDEGVRSLRDLEQIARYQAASMVCVKIARVGGVANARTMILRANELKLVPYLGGFFESPYGRYVHRILAEHCVDAPSDLSPVVEAGPLMRSLSPAKGGMGMSPDEVILTRSKEIGSW